MLEQFNDRINELLQQTIACLRWRGIAARIAGIGNRLHIPEDGHALECAQPNVNE
jgi:hypothetical protein